MKKGRIFLYFLIVGSFFFYNFYFRPIEGNILITDEYKNSSEYINALYKSDEYFKKHLLSEDSYYMYDEIIKTSLESKIDVSIKCKVSDCSNVFYKAIEALYLDHPELISFYGTGAYTVKNNSINYTNPENLDRIRAYLGTKRIEREMENIRKDTKDMNEKEKIIYVYKYVASHNYDKAFMFSKSNQSAYSFFSRGSSVCAGFAKASQIIFQNIGINSLLVLSTSHMWNYVEYEGKYYVFDATMGTAFYQDSPQFYDGLGKTTIDSNYGLFTELYPPIETSTTLKQIFNL